MATRNLEQINRYICNLHIRTDGGDQLKNSWEIWYGKIPWYERTSGTKFLREAKTRVNAFDAANGTLSTSPFPPSGGSAAFGAESGSTLRAGSQGPDVQRWQKILGIHITGIFDQNTVAATQGFQQAHGLPADGVVGPMTWSAAPSVVSIGSMLAAGWAKVVSGMSGAGKVAGALLFGVAAAAVISPSPKKKAKR